ncbi:MAG: hypothetical protein Q4D58_11845 [Synergistaceae bacterium]|nr:hypothetical protein [Synergistaceae bacterium]
MISSVLPYWDQNIDLDIAPWIPYGKDYSPVTVNTLCDPLLGSLAGLALEMKSEFLYLRSFQSGSVGTMARQNIIDPVRNCTMELGFTMVFSYSEQLEQCVLPLLRKYPGLMAGLTICDIWRDSVLIDECKVLMLVDEDPFFDEATFIKSLHEAFQFLSGRLNSNLSFFAERFGYHRFSISYETDDLTQMRITQALFDMELEATKEVLGPVPELKIPVIPTLR